MLPLLPLALAAPEPRCPTEVRVLMDQHERAYADVAAPPDAHTETSRCGALWVERLPGMRPAAVGTRLTGGVGVQLGGPGDWSRHWPEPMDPALGIHGGQLLLEGEVNAPWRPLAIGGWGIGVTNEDGLAKGGGLRLRIGTPTTTLGERWAAPGASVAARGALEFQAGYRTEWDEELPWELGGDVSGALSWRRFVVGGSLGLHRYLIHTDWWSMGVEAEVMLGVVTGETTLLGVRVTASNLDDALWPLYAKTGAALVTPILAIGGDGPVSFHVHAGVAMAPGNSYMSPYPYRDTGGLGFTAGAGFTWTAIRPAWSPS